MHTHRSDVSDGVLVSSVILFASNALREVILSAMRKLFPCFIRTRDAKSICLEAISATIWALHFPPAPASPINPSGTPGRNRVRAGCRIASVYCEFMCVCMCVSEW